MLLYLCCATMAFFASLIRGPSFLEGFVVTCIRYGSAILFNRLLNIYIHQGTCFDKILSYTDINNIQGIRKFYNHFGNNIFLFYISAVQN